MRPARLSDFDAVMELAELSGPGFTSLPVNEALIRSRIEQSVAAFNGDIPQIEYGRYFLILEDTLSGDIGGCSAVKAGTGIDAPFFNYRIITVAQANQATETRFNMDALVLTNEFVGYTEVGTLFLKPSHRGGGAGRLAGQSRFLLMAASPERFGDMVLAELRGVVDKQGQTPFWDAIGQHFFNMSFQEADYLSATTDNQFILDLMPKYPIYVDLLPPEAREVIGRCHAEGVGARKLLEWEGFRFERTVDIFDGGPMVAGQRRNLRTIQESQIVTLKEGRVDLDGTEQTGLISTDNIENFRVTTVEAVIRDDNELVVDPLVLNTLGLKTGSHARVWLRS